MKKLGTTLFFDLYDTKLRRLYFDHFHYAETFNEVSSFSTAVVGQWFGALEGDTEEYDEEAW